MTLPELTLASYGYAIMKGTRHEPRPFDVGHDTEHVDRKYCLVNEDRMAVLTTVKHPSMMAVRTSYADGEFTVTIRGIGTITDRPEDDYTADGTYWHKTVPLTLLNSPLSDAFSEYLKKPVRLARSPHGATIYGEKLTVITTGTVSDVGKRANIEDLAFTRFRPNLLIEDDRPYIEDTWMGEEVRVNGVRLRIGSGLGRCAVINRDPMTGERAGNVLQPLLSYRPTNVNGEPLLAVYATVVED